MLLFGRSAAIKLNFEYSCYLGIFWEKSRSSVPYNLDYSPFVEQSLWNPKALIRKLLVLSLFRITQLYKNNILSNLKEKSAPPNVSLCITYRWYTFPSFRIVGESTGREGRQLPYDGELFICMCSILIFSPSKQPNNFSFLLPIFLLSEMSCSFTSGSLKKIQFSSVINETRCVSSVVWAIHELFSLGEHFSGIYGRIKSTWKK